MTNPNLSPDGQWIWNGQQWIPAPPSHSPMPQNNVEQSVTLQDSVISGDVIHNVNNSPEAISKAVITALSEVGLTKGVPATVAQKNKIQYIENLISQSEDNLSPEIYYKLAQTELELMYGVMDNFQLALPIINKAKVQLQLCSRSAIKSNDQPWEFSAKITLEAIRVVEHIIPLSIQVQEGNLNYESALEIYNRECNLFFNNTVQELQKLEVLGKEVNLVHGYMDTGEILTLLGIMYRWRDSDKSLYYYNKAAEMYQKVIPIASKIGLWEKVAEAYIELLDIFSSAGNFTMAEYSFKEGSRLIQLHNLPPQQKYLLFINQISFIRLTKTGAFAQNEIKQCTDIVYQAGFEAGISMSAIEAMLEQNDDSDMIDSPLVPLNQSQQIYHDIDDDFDINYGKVGSFFLGVFFLIFGLVDIIGSHNGYDLWADLGFDLPEVIWFFTGYIEIGLAMLFFGQLSD
jgi:tetratricopeptide (TPR) repeat protein